MVLMNDIKNISSGDNYIFESSESDFVETVIEKSNEALVIVDFWAPWCGPCKQLTPTLEEVVRESKGKVFLSKINIDENQQIAAQMRIQSIPTVVAFKNKQIVDGFQGALPKTKIIEFIEKALGGKIQTDNSEFYNSIKDLLEKKSFEEAKNLLEEFLSQNSEDIEAIVLYIKSLIELEMFEETKNFISSLSDEVQKNDSIKSELSNLEIKQNNKNGPSLDDLIKSFEADKKNLDKMIKLSEKYFSEKKYDESFTILLENFLKLKEKDQQKLKKVLLKFFDALGNKNDYTKEYRRKFSSIFFS